jgi:hypothetical protein
MKRRQLKGDLVAKFQPQPDAVFEPPIRASANINRV